MAAPIKTHAQKNEDRDRKTRNRDIPLLSRVLCIMQDIYGLEENREWTRDRLFQTTRYLTGMPGGKGGSRGLEDTIAKISAMDDRHAAMLREYARELETAEQILNSIQSRNMRTFVCMYYIRHCTREEVCAELGMTEWGFRKAKEAIEKAERMEKADWRECFLYG